jgi:hypothetical protein
MYTYGTTVIVLVKEENPLQSSVQYVLHDALPSKGRSNADNYVGMVLTYVGDTPIRTGMTVRAS